MNKSTQVQTDRLSAEIDYRYQYVPSEHTSIRNTFERIRSQLAQEAEQKVVRFLVFIQVSEQLKPNCRHNRA